MEAKCTNRAKREAEHGDGRERRLKKTWGREVVALQLEWREEGAVTVASGPPSGPARRKGPPPSLPRSRPPRAPSEITAQQRISGGGVNGFRSIMVPGYQ